jgi:hypothetical protein
MKKIIITAGIILLTIISIGFYLFSQSEEYIFLEAKFQDCPYGHNSLKAVSISYGFPAFEEIESDVIIDEHTVLGGSIIHDDSPKYTVICKVCGFQKSKFGKETYWDRHSKDVESFEIPLKSIITDFPVKESLKFDERNKITTVSYIQQISNAEVIREIVSYSSNASYSTFRDIFSDFASKNDLNLMEIEYSNYESKLLAFKANKDGIFYEIDAHESEVNGSTIVRLEWRNFDYYDQ